MRSLDEVDIGMMWIQIHLPCEGAWARSGEGCNEGLARLGKTVVSAPQTQKVPSFSSVVKLRNKSLHTCVFYLYLHRYNIQASYNTHVYIHMFMYI